MGAIASHFGTTRHRGLDEPSLLYSPSTTWGNQAKEDKIESPSTVSCSSRWMDTKEIFHILMRKHSESAWTTAPVKASTGKAVQQYNGIQIIRIGSSRKANGTTGEAWDGIQFILFFSLFSNSYKSIKERSCSERRVVWYKASRCDGYGLARRFHVWKFCWYVPLILRNIKTVNC